MGRAPCCDKANVKKGPWSPDEDAKLKSYIEENGTGGNWIALPQKIGLKRCGKSCRLRWLNYLRPNIKHGGFSEEEDSIICSLYIAIGSRWSIIAAQLPGRTDNDIKNYWNTRLKKKLMGKQRKDHQLGRRVLDPKQEAKKPEEGTPRVANGCNQTTCWVEPTMPVYPTNQAEGFIRRLLLKLGGRFSSDNGTDHVYNNCVNPMVPFVHPSSMAEGCSTLSDYIAPVSSGITGELDEMNYCNLTSLGGLDCLYEPLNMVNESLSWSEHCPLIYPAVASTFQVMQNPEAQ